MDKSTREEIREFIRHWERVENLKNEKPPCAAVRARHAHWMSRELKFEHHGMRYHCVIRVTCSKSRFYVSKSVNVNDEVRSINELKVIASI